MDKENSTNNQQSTPAVTMEQLMTSQLPGIFTLVEKPIFHTTYIKRLKALGFNEESAEKLFQFEDDTIKKFDKKYMWEPNFTRMWMCGLEKPFLEGYPEDEDDLLEERFFTVSELCKFIDEAEWHFWNSHERIENDEVWAEIYQWRRSGAGGEFTLRYCEMLADITGASMKDFARLINANGEHLDRYIWS